MCAVQLNYPAAKLSRFTMHHLIFYQIFLKVIVQLIKITPQYCKYINFDITSGEMRGIYHFKSGSYGLTEMTAELQATIISL